MYVGQQSGTDHHGDTDSNTAVGYVAQGATGADGGSFNTSVGRSSLANTSDGSIANTAVGAYAGGFLTTGKNNTFMGYSSGNNTTTVDGNSA